MSNMRNGIKEWKGEFEKETGISLDTNPISKWNWEQLSSIMGKKWFSILSECRDKGYTVNNIVAITGKDTRKTTVWIVFLWWLMNNFPWLNGTILRDTIENSKTQMMKHTRKALNLIEDEYGVKGFNGKSSLRDFVEEKQQGFWIVRDKKSKGNQLINFVSFDSMVGLGGFANSTGGSAIFIYDELQNPLNQYKNTITRDQFLANYKMINTKNEAIEKSNKLILPKWIPRNIFLSNRYIDDYPLNKFAEEHFPYFGRYDEENDINIRGIRDLMLENPIKNNFFWKYIGEDKVSKEWLELKNTVIVYANKFSNDILLENEDWKREQLKLVERGKPDDLAIILGDIFEGYTTNVNAYNYSNITKISEEELKKKLLPYTESVMFVIDIDFYRQIVISPSCLITKEVKVNGKKEKVGKLILDKIVQIPCDGLDDMGFKYQKYIDNLHKAILKLSIRVTELIPHIKQINIFFDEKSTAVASIFNLGKYKHNFWIAKKLPDGKLFPIVDRPQLTNLAYDTGFIIEIDKDKYLNLTHKYRKRVIIKPEDPQGKRYEKGSDMGMDFINATEWPLYFYSYYLKQWLSLNQIGEVNEW